MSDELENLNGRIVRRGSDGKFERGGTLDPKVASEMGKRSRSKKYDEVAAALLQEIGYENPSDAPKLLQLQAEYIASQRSGFTSAVKDFRQIAGIDRQPAAKKAKLKPGEICPCCELPYEGIRIDQATAVWLKEFMEAHIDEREQEKKS